MTNTTRYVIFAYLCLGLVVWVTFAKLFVWAADVASVDDMMLLGSQFRASTLAGLIVALSAGIYAVRRKEVFGYCEAVVEELRKVTWPERAETQSATVVVILTTLLISLILGVFDVLWAKFTGFIYT
jgi:preprotein translocase SecE subunit